jgi:hypothetical protein|tara:strand:- start:625 stop:2772 length:2148 start_codon:yes stop_codon:yes gene_type:complete
MAIDNRIQYKFRSDKGTYYRLTIIDTSSSTSTLYDDVFANDEGFKLTYETNDDDRFTGLIPSKVDLGFFIDDNSGDGNPNNINIIINSIRTSDYKRWQLKIENSTNDSTYYLFWVGNFLNDINAEDDISLPREIKLTAICGLGALDNIPFNEVTIYNFNVRYSCYRYIYNSLLNDIDTENNWGTDDRFIRSVVDWTNSQIPRTNATDPLNNTRFLASAYAPVDDNGTRQPKTAFNLLNDICKVFGARFFLSDGKWTFIQVNTYEQMNSSDQFYRDYKKGNNGATFTPDFYGTYSENKTEDGTNIQRLAGNNFDYLAILKEANLNYEMFRSYDLIPTDISGNAGTQTPLNNALVAWNGWHSVGQGFNTDGGIYGINDDSTDIISFDLGELTLLDGQSIRFKRRFNRAFNGTVAQLDAILTGSGSILFYHRLKLVGTSSTRYSRSTYTVGGKAPWTANSIFGNAPDYNVPYTFLNGFLTTTPTNFFDVDFETEEVPFAGDLFFECYAKVYHNYGQNDPDTGTEVTTLADQQKFYIYSAPESAADQLIQAYINGESTSQQFFRTTQNITNGVTYEVGEVLLGSGPSATAQGALSCYSGSAWDDGTNESWIAYGSGSGKKISILLLNEIMEGQNDGASIFNGSLKILSLNTLTNGYKFNNGITIDSKFYLPYQCSFNANEDTWQGEWYEINTSSPTLTDTIDALSLNNNSNNTSSTNSW